MTLSEFYKRVHETYNRPTYLVHLRIKYDWEKEYRDLNQLYEYDDELAQYVWSVDWDEGQECVEVVGFIDIADINVPERPHGEWLSHYDYCKKHDYIPSGLIAFWWCNKCEQGVEIKTNFCPNCGAQMVSLNNEIEKSKGEIVPDYRDGWRLREGEAE